MRISQVFTLLAKVEGAESGVIHASYIMETVADSGDVAGTWQIRFEVEAAEEEKNKNANATVTQCLLALWIGSYARSKSRPAPSLAHPNRSL